jgi:hypothetical protein
MVLEGRYEMMKAREHGTVRIVDGRKWHASFGSNWMCDGSHRSFKVRIWKGKGRGYIKGVGGPEFELTIPRLTWSRAYKLRKLGALRIYKLQDRVLRRIATNPNRRRLA